MKSVSKKIVSVLSAVAMMSTLFVSAEAADAGSYNAFGCFSTYNLGASQWGKDPANAGGLSVTDIDGGKKIALDNTIAKIQFNPAEGTIPTGYEWYTVSGSIKTDNDLAFSTVPYIYEAKEVSNTNVVTIGYRKTEGGRDFYQFKSSSTSDYTSLFVSDFSDWVDFKYVVHNTSSSTKVYAFFNGNLIGCADRTSPAKGVGSMIFETRGDANHSGNVYLKDVNYAWSNDEVKIPNSYSMDNRLMNGLSTNAYQRPDTTALSYDSANDAISLYSEVTGSNLRLFDGLAMTPIPQGYDFYKTSFKAKRDASYGAGTVVIDFYDHLGNSAAWFVIYRKYGWNQIQIKVNTATEDSSKVNTIMGFKDDAAWTEYSAYLDRTTNTVTLVINGEEVASVVPKKTLADLQYLQYSVNDVNSNYSTNDGATGPVKYMFKDYTTSWGDHDLRYNWEDDDSIELVNANINGVAIDTTIGQIEDSELDKVSIKNIKTGDYVDIKGSSVTGDVTYIDADLEIGVDYVLTVDGGITGKSGQYTGDDYAQGFRITKVYEQLGSDWENSISCTKNTPSNIGDVYFLGVSMPNNAIGTSKIANHTNFTQIYDIVPYRHYSLTKTWSNTIFYMVGGQNLALEQNTNGESFGDVKVAGVSKGSTTLKTPLGMECVEMGRDSANNPDGVLKGFTDASGKLLDTPAEIKTHQEVYTVTNDSFRIYSDVSGDMKLAYEYVDEADELSNTGYVQMQSSGRMLFGVKSVITTVPEFFEPYEITGPTYDLVDYGSINKDEARVGLFYQIKVSEVEDSLTLGVDGEDFTITDLGSFNVATALTYAILGARAAVMPITTDITVKSGEVEYTAE